MAGSELAPVSFLTSGRFQPSLFYEEGIRGTGASPLDLGRDLAEVDRHVVAPSGTSTGTFTRPSSMTGPGRSKAGGASIAGWGTRK